MSRSERATSARQQGLRIALLADANNPHTIKWITALAERRHELLLYSLASLQHNEFAHLGNVRVECLGLAAGTITSKQAALGKLQYLRAVPRLRRLLRKFDPHIVHSHYATSYGLLGLLTARSPWVVSVWGMDVYEALSSPMLRRLLRMVLKRACAVLSTSAVMARHVSSIVAREVVVTPFGVDMVRFAPAANPSPQHDVLTVGTVKTLEPKYGIEYLLRAFAQLPQYGVAPCSVRLRIVGSGFLLEDMRKLADELAIADRTEFVGRVPYDEVHQQHQLLDVAVFPSIDESESFGVSVVEAQACGVPVVVSRVGGLPEVVVDGETGYVVPARSPAALAEAVAKLLLNHELRANMGKRARMHVASRYTLSESVDLMERVYARLVPH
jgi:glycosyltransferase involved in cell wall biosynthesis